MGKSINYKNFQIIYDGRLDKIGTYEWGGFWVINQDNKKESYIRIKITDTVLNNNWKINGKDIEDVIQTVGILKIKIGLIKDEIPLKSLEEIQTKMSNSDKDYTIQSYEIRNKSYTDYIKFLEEELRKLEDESNSIGFRV